MRKSITLLFSCLLVFSSISVANAEEVKSNQAYVDVAAATLWTGPNLLRPIDEPSAMNPVNLWKWTKSMTLDEKLWLTSTNKLETQALLGQEVTIIDRQGEWAKVVVHGQPTPRNEAGYPGWVPVKQLTYNQEFAGKKEQPFVLITKPTAILYINPSDKYKSLEVSYNTRLPLISEDNMSFRVILPNGQKAWLRKNDGKVYKSQNEIPIPTGDDLVNTGKLFLGLPYIWAGTSGFGFDCSGFTHTIYKSHGITIPRDSGPQSKAGIAVERENLQKGDLLFFAYNQGKGSVHHVGMYIGDGEMIHSPNAAKTVEIIPVDTPGYIEEYAGARRYLP
ncbi:MULTISPECIES: C40 family peptidase [Bacillus]|uniref:C40 family peptidase n=1 Tax=Bacillus TaxID=1386 RepID=UPI00035E2EF0|nr:MULTISPECIES: C40 family peptidase [Bacillus]PEB42739.1 peptidase P60 [Bacillus pseudomycoides]PEJ35772.1 peptidase P60 [Bacillus pseudomycoides]PGE00146.1 peptidase P60 [Bacillus pseudomycoides]PGE03240.1 peptidase P60 [Bacillus pseudomycoides]PGE91004.1 peptidase P60 [Bacillus pseudomycoides]